MTDLNTLKNKTQAELNQLKEDINHLKEESKVKAAQEAQAEEQKEHELKMAEIDGTIGKVQEKLDHWGDQTALEWKEFQGRVGEMMSDVRHKIAEIRSKTA